MLGFRKVPPCLRRSGFRLREAHASAGVGRSRRQVQGFLSVPTESVLVFFWNAEVKDSLRRKEEEMSTQRVQWKIRCVIYDCDGVLFDSFEANTKLYNDLCAWVGRGPLSEEEMQYVHIHTVFEAIR